MPPLVSVRLMERTSGKMISAQVHFATEHDLFAWTQWEYAEQDKDRHWDWWGIFQEAKDAASQLECYALTAEKTLHGLMLLRRSGQEAGGQRAMAVDYLATNPVNRKAGSGLKHVGTTLLAVAIRRSVACRLEGRLWLESLPKAEEFYAALGFAAQGKKSPDGYAVFTLSASAAMEFLEETRKRGIIEP